MRYTILGIVLGAVAYATSAQSQTSLEPRYVQVIGAELASGWRFIDDGKYECTTVSEDTRLVQRYIRPESVRGITILNTRPGSPAANAELRCGDVIVAAKGKGVRFAQELIEIIQSLPAHSAVSLTIRRAIPGPLGEESRFTVSLSEPVEVQVKTVTLDKIAALKEQLPVRKRTFIDEPYGPLVNVVTTTTFVEKIPGHIEYTCTFSHRGEQDILPIESPFLSLLGLLQSTDLEKYQSRTITLDAYIDKKGIPTLTAIPIYIAQRIGMDGESMSAFSKTNPGAVGVIHGLQSKEENWYHWKRTYIHCFLPEVLSREVVMRVKRYERIGLGER